MNPTPAPQQNNQEEGEQININVPSMSGDRSPSAERDLKFKISVPPPEVWDEKPQFGKNMDISPKTAAPAPVPLKSKFQEAREPVQKMDASNPFPQAMPLADSGENPKSFKMMMAGTIIFLTILLVAAVFIFKKDAIVPTPANSPAASLTPTPNANLDTDKDGIPDKIENAIGANPNNADTDGDTFTDLNEIKNGYSPLIAGPAGKYTPEQWQAVKEEIKAADKNFYDKIFNE